MAAKSGGAGNQRPIIIVRKKKAAAHGHHGGAWKVAYADFVTAMMALFIVLWLLTQADMKLKQQLAQFFRNPGLMPGGAAIHSESGGSKQSKAEMLGKEITVVLGNPQNGMALTEERELEQNAKDLKKAVDQMTGESEEFADLKGSVSVKVTAEGLAIEIEDQGDDILFDLASTELKPGLVALLKRLGPVLGKLPNTIQVGGHTDARPYKAHGKTNWDLSYERANKARVVLEGNGVKPDQMARVLSYAASEPVNKRDPYASENRRLSILALRRHRPQY